MNLLMNAAAIRRQLYKYLDTASEKKLKAIYAIVEKDIKNEKSHYTAAEKEELDKRVNHYLNGGKMVAASTMNAWLKKARAKRK